MNSGWLKRTSWTCVCVSCLNTYTHIDYVIIYTSFILPAASSCTCTFTALSPVSRISINVHHYYLFARIFSIPCGGKFPFNSPSWRKISDLWYRFLWREIHNLWRLYNKKYTIMIVVNNILNLWYQFMKVLSLIHDTNTHRTYSSDSNTHHAHWRPRSKWKIFLEIRGVRELSVEIGVCEHHVTTLVLLHCESTLQYLSAELILSGDAIFLPQSTFSDIFWKL